MRELISGRLRYQWDLRGERPQSLSNDDDDSTGNITKNEFASFQTSSRLFGTRSIRQMWATFPGVEFLRAFMHVQIEKEKFVVVCPRPPQNVALGGFTS